MSLVYSTSHDSTRLNSHRGVSRSTALTLCVALLHIALISCEDEPDPNRMTEVAGEVGGEEELAGELAPRGGVLAEPVTPAPRAPRCGDGIVEEGEGCDDGGRASGDGCDANCVIEICGNGVLQVGEQCDEGAENSDERPDACRTTCRRPRCGDGVTDTRLGEECDDANLDNTDACRATCTLSVCGDGIVRQDLGDNDEGYEECDDGDAPSGDSDDHEGLAFNSDWVPNACRTNCKAAYCGDGVVDAGEECDLGDNNGSGSTLGSSCLDDCTRLRCRDGIDDDRPECQEDQPPMPIPTTCMNGMLDAGEECDPSVPDNTAPCKTSCELAVCGDGVLDDEFDEECDHGAANQLEPACAYGVQSCRVCTAVGATPDGEMGEMGEGSTEGRGCQLIDASGSYCGDGVVDERYELCDPADPESGALCTAQCRPETSRCGDGDIGPGEECDDRNSRDHDGCDFECRSECGNGRVDGSEECDDGDLNHLGGRAGCNLACGRADVFAWADHTEVTVRLPTADAITDLATRATEPLDGGLSARHIWLQAEADSKLEVCLYKPRGVNVSFDAFGDDLESSLIRVSAQRDTTQLERGLLTANSTPDLLNLPAVSPDTYGPELSATSCRRYLISEAGAYQVKLSPRVDLNTYLNDGAREALKRGLIRDRILTRNDGEIYFKAQLTLTRSLHTRERFTGVLPSPYALLGTPEALEEQVSDRYHAQARDGDRLYLRVSTDGLGDCAELGRALTLYVRSADSGRIVDPGRAGISGTPSACQVIIPSDSGEGVNGTISSGGTLSAGAYEVIISSTGHEAPLAYTLDLAVEATAEGEPGVDPVCREGLLCPHTPHLESVWRTSLLARIGRLPLYPSIEPIFEGPINPDLSARYDFRVPTSPLIGDDAPTTRLDAHLSGCIDGIEALLSVWRVDDEGTLSRQLQLAKRIDHSQPTPEATPEAIGAPLTRCQTMRAELTEGDYALVVEHRQPGDVLPTPLDPTVHRARSGFPFFIEADLARVIARGGRYTGKLHVTSERNGRADGWDAPPAHPLSWGDQAFMIASAPDVDEGVQRRVSIELSDPREACDSAGAPYQYELWLESARLTTPLNLANPNLETGSVSLSAGVAVFTEEGIPEFVVAEAPALEGCTLRRELILPNTPYRLTVRPMLDLSVYERLDELPETLRAGIDYQLDVRLPDLCGNGIVEGFEECDDANQNDRDECSNRCARQAVCGNGIIEEGERCDDQNLDAFDGCSNTCTVCGDGHLDTARGEECDASAPNSDVNECDARCTLRKYKPLTASFSVTGAAVNFEEEDEYELHVDSYAWLSARTEGCEDATGARRFDTVLKLLQTNNGVSEVLRESDDRAGSACSEITHYFAVAGTPMLTVESYRQNDILGYDLMISQETRLLFDEHGLCVQRGDESEPPKPISSCHEEPSLISELDDLNASSPRFEIAPDDARLIKLEVKRAARLEVEVRRLDESKPCPDVMTIDGIVDPLEGARRVNLTRLESDDALLCGAVPQVDSLGDPLVWTPGSYSVRMERGAPVSEADSSNQTERISYRLVARVAEPECGNGLAETGEECDLGSDVNSDDTPGYTAADLFGEVEVCRTDCTLPRCGDEVVDFREECDLGDANTDQGVTEVTPASPLGPPCRTDCTLGYCGDGIWDAGEACDLGAANSLSARCLPSCVEATCGDGNLNREDEVCDDGNNEDGDGCSADCSDREVFCGDGLFIPSSEACPSEEELNARCGDGELFQGAPEGDPRYEYCDDGNLSDGDGCSATCTLERVRLNSEISRVDSGALHLYELKVDGPGTLRVFTRGFGANGAIDETCEASDTVLTVYLMNPDTRRKSSLLDRNDDESPASRCALIELDIYRAGTYLIEVTPYRDSPRAPYQLTTIFRRDLSGGGSKSGEVTGDEYDAFWIQSRELEKLRITVSSPQSRRLEIRVVPDLETVYAIASGARPCANAGEGGLGDQCAERINNAQLTHLLDLARDLDQDGQPLLREYDEVYVMVRGADGDVVIPYQLDVSPICGNGLIDDQLEDGEVTGEECDDSARVAGDGCSAWCKVERDLCGNGFLERRYPEAGELEVSEECDSGHLITDPETRLHLSSENDGAQVMTQSYRVFFTPSDSSIDTTPLIIDASRLRAQLNSRRDIAINDNNSLVFEYRYPNDITIDEGEVDLFAIAESLEQELSPLVKAYVRDHELSLIVRSGKLTDPLQIRAGATPSPWTLLDERAVCDQLCTYRIQRLVSNQIIGYPEPNRSYFTLKGKVEAGDSDHYLFSPEGVTEFEAYTLGCEQGRTDTYMTLYRLEKGVPEVILVESDDLISEGTRGPEDDIDGDGVIDGIPFIEDPSGRMIASTNPDGSFNLSNYDGVLTEISVQHFPILTGTGYISVMINGESAEIIGVEGTTGKIQLKEAPALNDQVTVLYFQQKDTCFGIFNPEQNGQCDDQKFCSRISLELEAGDYMLEIKGYDQSHLSEYQLNFKLDRLTDMSEQEEDEADLPTALDSFKRDEFSGRLSWERHRIIYEDRDGVSDPFGRISITADNNLCGCGLDPGQCVGLYQQLIVDGQLDEQDLNTADRVVTETEPPLNLAGVNREVCNQESSTTSLAYDYRVNEGVISERAYSLLIKPEARSAEIGGAQRLKIPFSYQHCPNSDCSTNLCGNGKIDPRANDDENDEVNEICDDGDEIDDNTCTNKCLANDYLINLSDQVTNFKDGAVLSHQIELTLFDDQTQRVNLSREEDHPDYPGFLFYNRRYQSATYSSNGFIILHPDRVEDEPTAPSFRDNLCCTGGDLRRGFPLIAGYWEDFLGAAGTGRTNDKNTVYYVGNKVIFEWSNVSHYPSGNESTFSIILDLQDHTITTQCNQCTSDGGLHTQGLQSHIPSYFEADINRLRRSWGASGEITYRPEFLP